MLDKLLQQWVIGSGTGKVTNVRERRSVVLMAAERLLPEAFSLPITRLVHCSILSYGFSAVTGVSPRQYTMPECAFWVHLVWRSTAVRSTHRALLV